MEASFFCIKPSIGSSDRLICIVTVPVRRDLQILIFKHISSNILLFEICMHIFSFEICIRICMSLWNSACRICCPWYACKWPAYISSNGISLTNYALQQQICTFSHRHNTIFHHLLNDFLGSNIEGVCVVHLKWENIPLWCYIYSQNGHIPYLTSRGLKFII